eukprot:scaffold895_cov286-Prasinococcus_capsulatus_cf.AAC.8
MGATTTATTTSKLSQGCDSRRTEAVGAPTHARACIRAAACSAHCATRPSATLPCTCKQPPCALRAATASRQLSSLLGSRPSSTRSACTLWLSSSPPPSLPSLTPRAAGATIGGMVLRLSPGSTTHLCATLLRSKFQRSAATAGSGRGVHAFMSEASPSCRHAAATARSRGSYRCSGSTRTHTPWRRPRARARAE